MGITREDECLGFITGKCIYDGENACSSKTEEECFPPICSNMKISGFKDTNKIMCEKTMTLVDPWKICLNCNPVTRC